MFYRTRSVFCRVWLNNETITNATFLTHTNHVTHAKLSTHATQAKILWTHATHAKISIHATHVNYAKMLWTHAAHATHAKVLPTPPTHPRYTHHPRDLADSHLRTPSHMHMH